MRFMRSSRPCTQWVPSGFLLLELTPKVPKFHCKQLAGVLGEFRIQFKARVLVMELPTVLYLEPRVVRRDIHFWILECLNSYI
jgi:hypothetical protein